MGVQRFAARLRGMSPPPGVGREEELSGPSGPAVLVLGRGAHPEHSRPQEEPVAAGKLRGPGADPCV